MVRLLRVYGGGPRVKNYYCVVLLYVAGPGLCFSFQNGLNEHLIFSGSHLMSINVKGYIVKYVEYPMLAKKKSQFSLKVPTCSWDIVKNV